MSNKEHWLPSIRGFRYQKMNSCQRNQLTDTLTFQTVLQLQRLAIQWLLFFNSLSMCLFHSVHWDVLIAKCRSATRQFTRRKLPILVSNRPSWRMLSETTSDWRPCAQINFSVTVAGAQPRVKFPATAKKKNTWKCSSFSLSLSLFSPVLFCLFYFWCYHYDFQCPML